ncbi:16S rRNA pseudouridine(516) synthase RsuA [Pseudomonas sp. N040]|uniref:16S rRNA pseudouridine(516) synthase RsuA n=1 Tax=Pseudomonas sp. N040 TaxID=2785325 RepID=UPI0018A2C9B4|nr:16S rRNA pseudouridine(516) synthase RsuA [Pseudomonas sp. N040]MBF7729552.1 16S rRNA pseudouridine(516) synthase RsuA [Pseudomonas sp. N040]MBW7013192.1 16S rRNA pseudouridine(516) synthase RsuA [Pseudomonas sp. N040]
MRLDKFIAQTTDLSRALVKLALRNKRVMVNGEQIKDAGLHISPCDTVQLDGATLKPLGPRYFMLHKPVGYVSATVDSDHPTVLDLLDEPNKQTLHIAGRLDIDTTGLVLITDDGQWSHRVTAPRRECLKTYYVTLATALAGDAEDKLQAGLLLSSEKSLTRPATLERLPANQVRLTISEGKYHQVKRMFAALDNRVIQLHRERIGDITLDDSLAAGEYRPLTEAEINSIR